ncbi:MAG: Flp family type IVb pilin [Methylovirgula sp.]
MIKNALHLTRRFLQDETAAIAIEYGLIVAFIAVVIISSVKNLGTRISNKFTTINNALS